MVKVIEASRMNTTEKHIDVTIANRMLIYVVT